MQAKLTLAALAVVAACGATPAFAQELHYGIKFGGGLAMTGTEAQDSRGAFDFALTGEWVIRQKDELFAEFGYRFYRANWVERTRVPNKVTDNPNFDRYNFRYGVGYTPTGEQGYIFNSDPTSPAGRGAVDMRKDNLECWGFNFGYRYNLPNTDFYLHGALMLNFMIYQQEVIGDIRVYDRLPTLPATTAPQLIHREGLNFTPAVNAISPGFYVGGLWRVNKNLFTEFNLSWMNYSTVDYVPLAYTGQAAHVLEDKDSKVTMEFNFGLRF